MRRVGWQRFVNGGGASVAQLRVRGEILLVEITEQNFNLKKKPILCFIHMREYKPFAANLTRKRR